MTEPRDTVQHLQREMKDLTDWVVSLTDYMWKPEFHILPADEKDRIRRQLHHMREYMGVLRERIESNPVPPPKSRDFTPYPIGEILRYDHGQTALFIVERVEPADDPSRYIYYGRHCLGGQVGAYHKDCRIPDNVDLGIWFSKAACRAPRFPYDQSVLATYNGEVARGIVHTEEYKRTMQIMQAEFNRRQPQEN